MREPAIRAHPLQNRKKHRLLLELSWGLTGRLHEPGTHLAGVVFGTPERHFSELVPWSPAARRGLFELHPGVALGQHGAELQLGLFCSFKP